LKVHLAALRSSPETSSGKRPEFDVSLSIIGLGKGFRIQAIKLVNGKEIFTTQLVATNEEEIDRVTQRLASSLWFENNKAEVDNVTAQERDLISNKKDSYSRWAFKFGPQWAFGLGNGATLANLYLGYHWESADYRLGLFFDNSSSIKDNRNSDEINISHIGINGDWVFSRAANAPYIGTELSYGTTESPKISVNGFSTSLRIGYLFLRTSKAQLNTALVFRPVLQTVNGKLAGSGGLSVGLDF
jgi:hypothetical protein